MCVVVQPRLLKLPSLASGEDLGQFGVHLSGFPQRKLGKGGSVAGTAEAGSVPPEDPCACE